MGESEIIDGRGRFQRVIEFPLVAMLLAIAIFLAIPGMVAGLLEILFRAHPVTGSAVINQLIVSITMVLTYKLFIRYLGADPRDDLTGPGAMKQLFAGLAIGLLLFAAIVGVAAVLGVYRLQGPGDAHHLIPALVLEGLFPAVSEEILFRGILFRWIEEFAGTWTALVVSSLLFGLSHLANPNASAAAMAGIALEGGLLLGGAYMLTRRLWLPIGIHAAWNLSQGELFGIPVSGKPVDGLLDAQLTGSPLLTGNGFGLEASPIAMAIGTLCAVVLILGAARANRIITPAWLRDRP
jgi:membrane protease YdiL (CAAX protease family)